MPLIAVVISLGRIPRTIKQNSTELVLNDFPIQSRVIAILLRNLPIPQTRAQLLSIYHYPYLIIFVSYRIF